MSDEKIHELDVHILKRAFNSIGGINAPFSAFLLAGAHPTSAKLKEMSIEIVLGDDVEEMYVSRDLHLKRISEQPRISFHIKKCKLEASYLSKNYLGNDFKSFDRFSLEKFNGVLGELLDFLTECGDYIAKRDRELGSQFLAWIEDRRLAIPKSKAELDSLYELEEANLKARQELGPWEILDIDWSQYHKNARELLNEPFYWCALDGFGPHGNDTGADIFLDYRSLSTKKRRNGKHFLERLLDRWGIPDDQDDELSFTVHDNAWIALAFAQIKLMGRVEKDVRELALKALDRQWQLAESYKDEWPHAEERVEKLEKMEELLERLS